MESLSSTRAIATLASLLAALAMPAAALAQAISSVDVSKGIHYLQTSATNVVVNAGAGTYSFDVGVRGTGLASLTPAPTISGPIDTGLLGASFDGTLAYGAQESAWLWRGHFPSASELDARFGSGTYTLTVNGTVVPLRLTGAYPNPPMVSFSQGEWIDGKFHFDPSRPLTITTNAFAGYAPKGSIWLHWGIGDRQQLAVDNPTNSMSVTVPANSYANGEEVAGRLAFSAVVDEYHGTFYGAAGYNASTLFVVKAEAPAPVFPMTVTSNITPTVATASAQIEYRPQDVGKQGSVFVFALAPATRVSGALKADVLKVGLAQGGSKADEPVACVLAQLNSAGQMQAVSSANFAAYLTGVLGSQGASVSILNNVPTPNVAGATFFVGYGPDGTTMINSGVNRAAVTVPGSLTCEPKKPQTGWWWNPLEDGRGFSLEVRGNNMFFAAFLYDVSGRSTWHVSTGPASLEGSYYTGPLYSAAGGQTLGGPYQRFPTLTDLGNITIAFNNESTGTLVWPGGTVPIQRFNIVPNGLNLPAVAGQPESGWWWNPEENGRGFFMEWQNGWLDIAGYMYDDNGDSVWYLTVGEIGGSASTRSFSGNWWRYGDGMPLMGPWRQHRQTSNNVAPLTITFSGPDTALMTLPNGRTTNLRRHRF